MCVSERHHANLCEDMANRNKEGNLRSNHLERYLNNKTDLAFVYSLESETFRLVGVMGVSVV